MVTSRDFEAIAAIIRDSIPLTGGTVFERTFHRAIVTGVAQKLADYFERSNPRFDRERFYKAAGVLLP